MSTALQQVERIARSPRRDFGRPQDRCREEEEEGGRKMSRAWFCI